MDQPVAQSQCFFLAGIVFDGELVSKHSKAATGKSCNSELERASPGQQVAKNAMGRHLSTNSVGFSWMISLMLACHCLGIMVGVFLNTKEVAEMQP